MSIVNLLTELSNRIVDNNVLAELVKSQPNIIRDAIQSGDINKFKSQMPTKQSFINEVQVTIY